MVVIPRHLVSDKGPRRYQGAQSFDARVFWESSGSVKLDIPLKQMTPPPKTYVADVHTNCSPWSVRFIDLLENQSVQEKTNHRRILGVSSAADIALRPDSHDRTGDVDHEKYQHTLSKGHKTAVRLESFLNGSQDSHEEPSVELLEDAVISGSPCAGAARDREGITSFHTVNFRFRERVLKTPPLRSKSTQMLHVACGSLKSGSILVDELGKSNYESIAVISGMCLFSDKIMRASVLESGSLDVSKLYYSRPTLYEMESIARTSPVIADIAAQILTKGTMAGKIPFQVVLDAPSWHYYQVVHDNLVGGRCTSAEALDWLRALELRCEQMTAVFENAVRHELGMRGVSSSSYEILVAPGTIGVGGRIQSSLVCDMVPCISESLACVSQSEGGAWAAFDSLVPEKEKPQNFRTLGNLFYIYESIRPALQLSRMVSHTTPEDNTIDLISDDSLSSTTSRSSETTPDSAIRPLIISIDDRAERKIYSKAQAFIKKINKSSNIASSPTLVEIYTSRRIFFNSNADGDSLYWNDPSLEHLRLDVSNEEGGSPVGPELDVWQIIRTLYGNDCASNMERWFLEVGLY